MSNMTPREAADIVSPLDPDDTTTQGAALRVLVDHARATAPEGENLVDRDGDRWRDHGDDSWWPVNSPKLSTAQPAGTRHCRQWVERHFGPLVPASAPGTVRDPERAP